MHCQHTIVQDHHCLSSPVQPRGIIHWLSSIVATHIAVSPKPPLPSIHHHAIQDILPKTIMVRLHITKGSIHRVFLFRRVRRVYDPAQR